MSGADLHSIMHAIADRLLLDSTSLCTVNLWQRHTLLACLFKVSNGVTGNHLFETVVPAQFRRLPVFATAKLQRL